MVHTVGMLIVWSIYCSENNSIQVKFLRTSQVRFRQVRDKRQVGKNITACSKLMFSKLSAADVQVYLIPSQVRFTTSYLVINKLVSGACGSHSLSSTSCSSHVTSRSTS